MGIYLMSINVEFQEKDSDGHWGFDMQEGLFHSMENAKAHARKWFPEAENFVDDPDDVSRCKFVLEAPMVSKLDERILAKAGDKAEILIEWTEFLD